MRARLFCITVLALTNCSRTIEVDENTPVTTPKGFGLIVESSRAHRLGDGIAVRVVWSATNTTTAPLPVSTKGLYVRDSLGRFFLGLDKDGGEKRVLQPGEKFGPHQARFNMSDVRDASGLLFGPAQLDDDDVPTKLLVAVRLNVQDTMTTCDELWAMCVQDSQAAATSHCNAATFPVLAAEAEQSECARRLQRLAKKR